MPQRTFKTAAELESITMAELREHAECKSVGGVIDRRDAGLPTKGTK
jgi:hypothetical protein